MRFSQVLKSSPHCLPSPDGTLIATLLSSSISIRTIESLETVRTIKLPADVAGSVTTFVWSPSSRKLLLAGADEVHVFSVTGNDYHAIIRNPSSTVGKSTVVDFGADDNEACVYSAFGIKLSIFDISSAKAVEISNPKFYLGSSAARGFSFRPNTRHLALLTRSLGKDIISIHSPGTREALRSWSPGVTDAQGLAWTPDGRWLVVWESAAQGHKVLFYTPDGHVFKDWSGPLPDASSDMDYREGAGVKLITFSPNSEYIAVSDHGRTICMLHTSTLADHMRLRHPLHVEPRDTLQIWQEQAAPSKAETLQTRFIKASQSLSPPGLPSTNAHDLKSGCGIVTFDSSSTLVATTLEDAPSTIWIWDVLAAELRAVLVFYAKISRIDWHPVQPELLFVKCEGESHNGVIFVWDPLSEGPMPVDVRSHFPDGKISGRAHPFWLKSATEPAALFFTDNKACILVALAESDDEVLPWQSGGVSVNRRQVAPSVPDLEDLDSAEESDGAHSEMDDTFHFKRFRAG